MTPPPLPDCDMKVPGMSPLPECLLLQGASCITAVLTGVIMGATIEDRGNADQNPARAGRAAAARPLLCCKATAFPLTTHMIVSVRLFIPLGQWHIALDNAYKDNRPLQL